MTMKWLDRLLNIAIVVACAGVLAAGARRFGVTNQAAPSNQTANAGSNLPLTEYAKGEPVGRVGDVDFSTASHTLIAFVQSHCQYCINSMPFYRTLGDEMNRSKQFHFVVAGPESAETLTNLLRRYHVEPYRTVSVSDTDSRVIATPTLVLVDRKGMVTRVWIGEQPQAKRALIKQLLLESES
jgi:hypothetical protein